MGTESDIYRAEHVDDEVEKTDGPNPIFEMTIFANERARSGPDVILAGMSLTNYRKNPVVLWAHNGGLMASDDVPIARTSSLMRKTVTRAEDPEIDPEKKILRARFQFLPNDQFADRVRNAFEEGFLRAASISWRATVPAEVVKDKDDKPVMVEMNGWSFPRIRHPKSELLEWSLVPVPSDPDAIKSIMRSLMTRQFEGVETLRKVQIDAGVGRTVTPIEEEDLDVWVETVHAIPTPAATPTSTPSSTPTPTPEPSAASLRLRDSLKEISKVIRSGGE